MVFGDYFRRRIAPLQERSRVGQPRPGEHPGCDVGRRRRQGSVPSEQRRTSGSGGGGSSKAPGPSRGPGEDSADDPKGKWKMYESQPPSLPRGGGAERVPDRPLTGHKRRAAFKAGRQKKRLRKIGQTEPCWGSFIEPPKWTFKRPTRRSGAESTIAETRPAAGICGGGVPPRGNSEGATHEERHPGSEAEAVRDPKAEAGGGLEPEAEAEAGGGPEPEAEAEFAEGPKTGGDRDSRSPLHLGRPQGRPRGRGAESSPQSRGGSCSTLSSRGRTATFSSPTPASMEQLLQVLAVADSTVREGLNAQVQALAEERAALEVEWAQLAADRARVDEGRRVVDDMVEYEAHAEDLAKRVEDAREVLDAAAAQERRASEAEASLRAWTAALEAECKADERARSALEFEPTIHRRIEVLDRNQREQDMRGREQAQRARELEGRAQALEERVRSLDQRESTLAAHERTAAEAESFLRLREEAAAKRDRTTLAAKALVACRAEEL
uniref:Erythrocyte binding protein-like n=2 Tax=Oryza sativa subsp. japonica TaxID=39947 RepID=Q5GM78_ORYSJ|nr:erythrocyte binding protein-like [Oryza sativa Japonica Group]BAD89363.1 erythrocyte binding protein-like [Oryza sativa Japonica Group]